MKEYKIETEVELSAKRFYLPLVIQAKCGECGEVNNVDLDQSYLSYPTLNKYEKHYVACDACDSEMELNIKLKISIEVK